MSKKTAVWLLRATSLWTFWVWAILIRNMVVDRTHRLGFRLVHIGLAFVSIGLGATIWSVSNQMSRDELPIPSSPTLRPGDASGRDE